MPSRASKLFAQLRADLAKEGTKMPSYGKEVGAELKAKRKAAKDRIRSKHPAAKKRIDDKAQSSKQSQPQGPRQKQPMEGY